MGLDRPPWLMVICTNRFRASVFALATTQSPEVAPDHSRDEVDNTPLGARLAEPSTVRSKLRRPSTVDDLAGVPLLISAPGSHCERSTRAEATRRWHRLIAYARGHKNFEEQPHAK